MGHRYWTPEQKKRHEELQKERDQLSYAYQWADEIVREAMALFEKPDLRTLKNAMYFAHCYLNEELRQWPEKNHELGLDLWIAAQEKADELEEQVRLDQAEEEREQQEEEKEQERLEQEEEERLEAASRSSDSESA